MSLLHVPDLLASRQRLIKASSLNECATLTKSSSVPPSLPSSSISHALFRCLPRKAYSVFATYPCVSTYFQAPVIDACVMRDLGARDRQSSTTTSSRECAIQPRRYSTARKELTERSRSRRRRQYDTVRLSSLSVIVKPAWTVPVGRRDRLGCRRDRRLAWRRTNERSLCCDNHRIAPIQTQERGHRVVPVPLTATG